MADATKTASTLARVRVLARAMQVTCSRCQTARLLTTAQFQMVGAIKTAFTTAQALFTVLVTLVTPLWVHRVVKSITVPL